MSKVAEPIVICDYDPVWPQEFKEIGASLRRALGDFAERIDHIGSTSVPELASKPIIDVQVSVRALEPMEYLPAMESLGYVWKASNPQLTKRYFREQLGQRRTHIHVRKTGSWHEQFPLLFRDYVRSNAIDRALYERTKKELAVVYRNDRNGYVEAKDPVIWEIMQRADLWAAENEWAPGTTDA